MYRSIDDFLKDWTNEESGTLKLYACITDETKPVKIHEQVRSLERLAWHLTQTITEMGCSAGLFEKDALHGLPIPETMAEIIANYQDYSRLLMRAVPLKWTDSALADEVPMYGESWKKGDILKVMIMHQTHHRGQMTVIMRMLGLPVPGLYGPSKEEWQEMGLPALD